VPGQALKRRATMDKYEDLESSLDPHRSDERRAAAAEVVARLRGRGIAASDIERSDDLADLLSAVERFEAAVEAHGGDLMVDDLKSQQPDDQHFVIPRRVTGEAIRAYIGRIDEATERLRRHAPHPD
jgi:broad specificity phosphatase PhoE